jgi:hypothetical protein
LDGKLKYRYGRLVDSSRMLEARYGWSRTDKSTRMGTGMGGWKTGMESSRDKYRRLEEVWEVGGQLEVG